MAYRTTDDPFPWLPTESGYTAEISTLQGNGALVLGLVSLPDGTASWSAFKAQRNSENEITHWEATLEGKKYVVFND